MSQFRLRTAQSADADAVAAVFSPSLRLTTFLPELHTVAEDRWFIGNVILAQCDVTVAEADGRIIAFLARQRSEIRLLHTHPNAIGQGAGSQLIEREQSVGPPVLELWCFQANRGARRFYERHGFQAVRFTDGARNEEKMPDVTYRWTRSPGA